MPSSSHPVLTYLRSVRAAHGMALEEDHELLRRLVERRDEEAFTALLRRHGPMVLSLADRVAGDEQTAEDVFQAVFIWLFRKGHTIRRPQVLSCWLHGVAQCFPDLPQIFPGSPLDKHDLRADNRVEIKSSNLRWTDFQQSKKRLGRRAIRRSRAKTRSFSMTRGLLLALPLLVHSLVGHSPAAPAPKPRPKGAEALLYIKRVPGRTDKEQAEIRQTVRHLLIFDLVGWIQDPQTEIPGVNGPVLAKERSKWQSRYVQWSWVEDTGVLRITCQAGTPREQVEFVNNAVKHGIAYYEQQKKARKKHLTMKEEMVRDFGSRDDPRAKKIEEDALNDITKLQRFIADLSEVVVLDLAEVPHKGDISRH